MNKALLVLDGHPLFIHVLRALDRVREVDRVYVVGPKAPITEAVEAAASILAFSKRVTVLDQKKTLLENALFSYAQSCSYATSPAAPKTVADPPALFLPADIPFVTTAEIETFISHADMTRYDYCLGVAPETSLSHFYPHGGKPGVRMAYLYLRDKVYRVNNLHLVRPYRVGMLSHVQTTYDLRYQNRISNRVQTILEILKTPRCVQGLLLYLLAQGRHGYQAWASRPQRCSAVVFCPCLGLNARPPAF